MRIKKKRELVFELFQNIVRGGWDNAEDMQELFSFPTREEEIFSVPIVELSKGEIGINATNGERGVCMRMNSKG